MLEMSWKWKLNDKRTQGRYVDKGIVKADKVQESLAALPDLSSQAACVEIAMDDLELEGHTSSDSHQSSHGGNSH